MSDNGTSVVAAGVVRRSPARTMVEIPAPVHTAEEHMPLEAVETASFVEETPKVAVVEQSTVVVEPEAKGNRIPPGKRNTIQEMVEKGFNAAEVARHLGISYPTARKYVQEFAGSRPAKVSGRKAAAKPAAVAAPKKAPKMQAKEKAPVRRGRPPTKMAKPVIERRPTAVPVAHAKPSQFEVVLRVIEWAKDSGLSLGDIQSAMDPALRFQAAFVKQ